MRILYREKQLYNSRLSTAEIMEKIIEFGQIPKPDTETLKGAMTQLTDWGNVTAMQELKDVHTIEEYKNKACHYSIMERAVIELENMFSKGNVLSVSFMTYLNGGEIFRRTIRSLSRIFLIMYIYLILYRAKN